ncbi:MAG: hypothetical protein PHO79_07450 [Desulfoplanes sp.]|nr:hypothetical protein [Desulfoplanes sp.]
MSSIPTDPTMHTAEHLLNQTMIRMFGCERCFSAHINRKKSKCDYHFSRELRSEEIREIETRMNAVIKDHLPVTCQMISWEEACTQFNTARVPETMRGKDLRIVAIGTYDACPCIGEHATSTNELGAFCITSASFENDVLRIRFKLNRPC